MSTAVVPFNFAAPAPALAKQRASTKNAALMISTGPSFPVLSIKGKIFTLVKNNERKPLMRTVTNEDGTQEQFAVSTLALSVVAANPRARVYYDKGFTEGESENNKPTCCSYDGLRPDASIAKPQAKSCQVCPHAAWGSKTNDSGEEKGTACAPRTRLAVTDPNKPAAPFLLDLPPASRRSFNDAIQLVDTHGRDFDEVAFKVSFDLQAATPKLLFTPYGVLTDEAREKVQELAKEPVVADIIGTPKHREEGEAEPAAETPAETPKAQVAPAPKPQPKPEPDPVVSLDEVEGALASTAATEAKAATQRASTRAKATPKPQPDPKPTPAAASAGGEDTGSFLGEIASLLNSGTDD